MGGILAGSEQPVDLIARRVVTPDQLIDLGGKVHLSVSEGHAVRTPEGAQVDPAQLTVKVGTTVTCDVSGGSGLATSQVTFTFTSDTGEVGTVKP